MTSAGQKADPRLAATRLSAIQAVYEIDFAEIEAEDALAEFSADRWRSADDEQTEEMAKPKPELLRELVSGVTREKAALDAVLTDALSKDSGLDGLEALVRALLRVAAFELQARPKVPARAILSTYAGLGDAFFDEDGPQSRLIAGVLNTAARQLRPDEFSDTNEATG